MMKQYFMGCVVHVHHKGGNSKDEMNRANQLQQQQNQIMQNQLAMQQKQLAMVNPSLQAIIQAGGMLPAQEAAMRSQATALTGQNELQAIGNINQALAARGITGGQMAGSGDIARNYGSLNAQLAAQQANLLNNIQLAKGQGLMSAIGTGLGEGQMFGQQALGFGNQSIGALNAGVTAANNADQASTGFWGSVIGGLAGLGSAGIGKIPCWVAAELYGGWDAPEVHLIRNWLDRSWYMRPFYALYVWLGEDWANRIKGNNFLRSITKRLFDLFLECAR